MWTRRARFWGVAAAAVALVAVPALPATGATGLGSATTSAAASVTPRVDYPSWDEVNAAKQNAEATKQQVANIVSLLDQLEVELAQREKEAFDRGQEYQIATYNLQVATDYAAQLQTRADAATERAGTANTQVGLLAAQLYRSGGDSTMNLLLEQDDSDSLLYRLGAMAKLTEQTAGIRDAAVAAQNTADALSDQADTASAERDRLADAAAASLATAEAAQADAQAEVVAAQAQNEQLKAQLASLDAQAADLQAKRQAGIDEENRQRAAAVDTDAPGETWVPGSGEIMTPAESQAYAASIMPEYGWGNDQFQCLVRLWIGESGWRANAYNESSGAYGIPQSLPASKMASAGADYVTNAMTQIRWGLTYISGRYDTPCGALAFWNGRNPHWY